MTAKQWKRLDLVERVARGELTSLAAATFLGMSLRNFRRLRRKIEKAGLRGVVHRNTGRVPWNRVPEATLRRIVELARTKYEGFNDHHLTEKLAEEEKLSVSCSTVRRALREAGFAALKKRRPRKHRRRRDRKAQEGLMLLWDGSRHDWLEGRGPWMTLTAAIDDATGQLMPGAHFVDQECAAGYLRVLVRGAGESPAKLTRAGTRSGYMGFDPYSSSYLPTKEGPLAKGNDEEVKRMIQDGFEGCNLVHKVVQDNANLDSAAKMDAAGAPDFRKRYLDDPSKFKASAETWEGLCHNWAPASLDRGLNFLVSMDKIYADVPFGIGDLRETLTSIDIPSRDYAWFGKRWNEKNKQEPEEDRLDPVDVLTMFENYVGKGKPGIILDIDPSYMVWNQAIYQWTRTADRVTDETKMGPKKPPAGGRAYHVTLDAKYGNEGDFAYRGETIYGELRLKMFVYTDKNGNIVDSAWDPKASNKIPDFAWVPLDRGQSDDVDVLKKIAKEGVSVKTIEEFCNAMAALTKAPTASERRKLKKLLDEICPILDQNKLSDYIRETAERIGMDYSDLEDSIRVATEAHS